MKDIIEYQVVKAESSEGVSNIVTNLIEDSWQPVEGVQITSEKDEDGRTLFYFYQTMVKYAE